MLIDEILRWRILAVLEQLPLDLQDRTINIVLDLVDLTTLPLNVREVNIRARPSEQSRYRCKQIDRSS
ncbi:MAG TPA: hypothetical protein VG498_12725 [Terriglobales bacterium]|nr:hypothetical protein [Terriglobales bacterium]